MDLLVLITFICFIIGFIHILTKPIITYLCGPSVEEKQLQSEISSLKLVLCKISVKDDYINYVKTERKIIALETSLKEVVDSKYANKVVLKYAILYGSQAILTLLLIIISLTYRYEPVIIFDNKFNFTPFGKIMRFPTGVNNGISVPFWIFVNSFVSRTVAGYFNKK